MVTSGTAWFEDESLWRALYPFLFNEQRFASAPQEVDEIIALTGVTPCPVLDLCCGPGRHSAALARKGFAVTAVDRSEFLLGKAREHAGGLPIEFVEADARAFRREQSFDLALSLFTSFGYFDSGENQALLQSLYASLRPGGVLVLDVLGKEQVAAAPCSTRWTEHDGQIFIDHHQVLAGWEQVRIDWVLVSGDNARRFELRLRLYSGAELAASLREAGFGDVHLFGSLAGSTYDASAKRLVAVASK